MQIDYELLQSQKVSSTLKVGSCVYMKVMIVNNRFNAKEAVRWT